MSNLTEINLVGSITRQCNDEPIEIVENDVLSMLRGTETATNLNLKQIDWQKDTFLVNKLYHLLQQDDRDWGVATLLVIKNDNIHIALDKIIPLLCQKFKKLKMKFGSQCRTQSQLFWNSFGHGLCTTNKLQDLMLQSVSISSDDLFVLNEACPTGNQTVKTIKLRQCIVYDIHNTYRQVVFNNVRFFCCQCIETIRLSSCTIQGESKYINLMSLLKACPKTLTTVDLNFQSFFNSREFIDAIDNIILRDPNCRNISNLYVRKQCFQDNSINLSMLCSSLTENCNSSLGCLHLTASFICDEQLQTIICPMIQQNTTLHTIDLRYNKITNQGAIALANCLKDLSGSSSKLQQVLLFAQRGKNCIDLPGLEALLHAVKQNPKIYKLQKVRLYLPTMKEQHTADASLCNVLEMLQYYLNLNYYGRHLIVVVANNAKDRYNEIPLGLWAWIIDRAFKESPYSTYELVDGLNAVYYILQESPIFTG